MKRANTTDHSPQKKTKYEDKLPFTLESFSESVLSQIRDKNVLKGQRRKTTSDKHVYILSDYVYKGPYENDETFRQFLIRSEIFAILNSQVVLPIKYMTDESQNIYVQFNVIAGKKPDQWIGVLDVDNENVGSNLIKLVDKASMGLRTGSMMGYFPKGFLDQIMTTLLDAFILRIGDIQPGNILYDGQKPWLIDYDSKLCKSEDCLELPDFLFKRRLPKLQREQVKSWFENVDHRQSFLDRIDLWKNNVTEFEKIGLKYGFCLGLAKRIDDVKTLCCNLFSH